MDISTVKTIEQFVLEAAAKTYAAGTAPTAFPGLSGSKLLFYDRPPFTYSDIYFTSPTGVSFGFTLVWHCTMEKPVWRMSYDGWYDRSDPRITKFLKAALRAGCNEFNGGRGPAVFTAPEFPGLVYYNHVAEDGFARFSGRDKIVLDGERDPARRERYWHEYRGGMLIEV